MRLFKQIAAGVLVTWGLAFSLVGVAVVFDDTKEDRFSNFMGCMMLGTPPLVWGVLLYRGLNQTVDQSPNSLTPSEVQDTFFWLLENNDGEITLMRFAMETRLPAEDARKYLDEAATQFNASFRVGDRGEVYYQFPIGDVASKPSLPHPENLPNA